MLGLRPQPTLFLEPPSSLVNQASCPWERSTTSKESRPGPSLFLRLHNYLYTESPGARGHYMSQVLTMRYPQVGNVENHG